MKTLHILNGDGTFGVFQQTGLEGETLIFRETFSEGEIISEVFSDKFWESRQKFISESYEKIIPPPHRINYDKDVKSEIEKINLATNFDDVVLWFEFDLHCQVNLFFCLNQLAEILSEKTTVKLICPNAHPEVEDFRGLGQLSPEQLKNLLPTAKILTSKDLKFAQRFWQAYLSPTPEKLAELAKIENPTFPDLPQAIEAHLARMPDEKTGLGLPERIILETVRDDQPTTIPELLKGFWKRDKIYGFGDLQILSYVEKISPKYITFDGKGVHDFEPTNFLHFSGKIESKINL